MHKPVGTGRAFMMACLTLATVSSAGCLVTRTSKVRMRGEALINADRIVEDGRTTREEIVRAFGRPAETLPGPEGEETFVYLYEEQRERRFVLLFFMNWRTESARTARFLFRLEDGVLASHSVEGL